MSLTPLLLFATAFLILLLVVAICVAVRLCNLEQVDLRANIWKFVNFSFSAKSRPHQQTPEKRTGPKKKSGGRLRR